MRQFGRLAAMVGLTVLATGCSSIRDHRGYLVDATLVDSVQAGIDNRTSVERTLGRPTFISQFGEPAWYYVAQDTKQVAFRRPRTSQQQILRVRFDGAGNVAAVDKASTEKIVFLDPHGDKTPTLGRERTFIEDLFGNIGAVGAPGLGGPGGGGPGGP
jgi:outer membrane protein assembly factor BamE (lipoprotein component of BamABCDE complex)